MTDFNVVLFDNFETLDAFGPAEIIGKMPNDYILSYYSLEGGLVRSSQNILVMTEPLRKIIPGGILLIPGGMGTRELVDNTVFITTLKELAIQSSYILTVCTGAALLARTGLLDGRRATSNKLAFGWVCSVNPAVKWVRQARWVVDERIYTSSGVSAGMDMTLGFIRDLHGADTANKVAQYIEYIWNSDMDTDPFA